MHDATPGPIRGRSKMLAAAVVAIAALAIVVAGAGAATARDSAVVKTAKNASLGETILVNRAGRTLYHLSAEKRGKFICTSAACLSLWHPLVVQPGTTPTGARSLSTVKRPDGRLQVAYRGGPLYTFAEDRKAGDVKGNGFKDVGVWRPATPNASAPAGSGSGGGTGAGGYGGGYGG